MKSILPSKLVGSAIASVLVSLGLYGFTTALLIMNNESGLYEDWMLYANLPGNILPHDGTAPQFASPRDRWPDKQANVLPIQFSTDAMNRVQHAACHGYLAFNPLYETPFIGGIPGTFEAGKIGALSSLAPASGASGLKNSPVSYGGGLYTASSLGPHDPDRCDGDVDSQRGYR